MIKLLQIIFIIGKSNELGEWTLENSHRLLCNNFPIWRSSFISFTKKDLEYKYIIKYFEDDKFKNKFIKWEDFMGNRKLKLSTFKDGLYLIDDGNFNDNTNQKIIKINENVENISIILYIN